MNTIHKKVGIVACSNGQKVTNIEQIKALETTLLQIGLVPVCSSCIYEKESIFSGTAKERAEALMDFYKEDDIVEIFDISGGDVANGILPYLDYEQIAKSKARFWGYSDLTTVLNAIYAKTGKSSVLYQIRNVLYQHKEKQLADFSKAMIKIASESMLKPILKTASESMSKTIPKSMSEVREDLFQISYRFIQGEEMQGVIIGGNIRCFLKLAGTEYMPDFNGKILLLESFSGTVAKMETYLCQLQQLGAFEKVAGILLGTFTEMEEKQCEPNIETLVKRIVGENLPIAVTREIGHGTDAKAIEIGKEYRLTLQCKMHII